MVSVEEEILSAASIGITGHIRPDGDCVGSTLGLYNYIRENMPDKTVDIYLDPIEKNFKFLSGASDIRHSANKNIKYDVFIILDCGDLGRVAEFTLDYIRNASKTICIDHHMSTKGIADVNHICPQISSASEVLFELLDENHISRNTAECLYTGMVHDTGVFKYQSTTSRTMQIAGKLMDKGIDFTSIIDDTFFRKSYKQNLLLGRALLDSERLLDGRLIYSYVSADTLKEYDVIGRDTGGIIDELRFTEGVEVAVFMYELPDGKIKTSLRSVHDVDVNSIAGEFGGGGHIRAAGFTTILDKNAIITKLEELVRAGL